MKPQTRTAGQNQPCLGADTQGWHSPEDQGPSGSRSAVVAAGGGGRQDCVLRRSAALGSHGAGAADGAKGDVCRQAAESGQGRLDWWVVTGMRSSACSLQLAHQPATEPEADPEADPGV